MDTRTPSTIHALQRVALWMALAGILLVAWHFAAQAQGPALRGIPAMQQATVTPAPTPRPVSTDVVIPRGRVMFYGRLLRSGWVWIGVPAIVVLIVVAVIVARRFARR
jgi:hypothetical protein